MSIGPVERLVVDPEEPALVGLLSGKSRGPVEFSTVPGRWLVDRFPVRNYFSRRYEIIARRVFPDGERLASQQIATEN